MNNNPEPTDSAADKPAALLDEMPLQSASIEKVTVPEPPKRFPVRAVAIVLLVAGMAVGGILGLRAANAAGQAGKSADNIKSQAFVLPDLSKQLTTGGSQQVGKLTVNGQVVVGSSLVVEAVDRPAQPVAGQIFYDKGNNTLTFFNGTDYVGLLGGNVINTQITNSPITNVFTTNVIAGDITNVTNVTNVIGGGLAGSGTAGAVAMFTGANQLGDSLITQSGTSLTVGSSSGASATAVQAGTGGLALTTGSTVGSSGSVTLMSGASSSTASGNVTVDTGAGIVDGTIVRNGSFETDTEDILPWTGSPMPVIVQDCTVSRTGACSLSMNTGSFGGALENFNVPGTIVVPGHNYFFSIWVKAATTPAPVGARIYWNNSPVTVDLTTLTDNTTGWTQLSGSGIAPAGSTHAWINIGFNVSPAQTHYFDDYIVTDLSSSSAVSELNLGATNAQFVTLGNMNQIGATEIYGGSGINLTAGVSSINANGGAIGLTAGAASSFVTTAGTLMLSSAETADWGVANAVTGDGGSLTLHSGDGAGGNDDGGNLTLLAGAAQGSGTAGNVNLVTAAANGATGNVTITTGDSATTASGNITIDSGNGIIDGTVVATKSFEGGLDGMQNWFGTTIAQSSAQAHAGSNSLAVTPTSPFWGVIEDQNISWTPVVAGHQYNFSIWVRADTVGRNIDGTVVWSGSAVTNSFNQVTDNNSGWTQMSLTTPAPAGATRARVQFSTALGAVGEIHYFDDFVATDLSSASAFSAISIGETNAKVITIGNINQIGATSIFGGSGISLAAGASSLTASAGALDMTGNAASSLKTTAGALTLTSADAATWGVATATSGDGGDLTLKAGNGQPVGNTNGGNLILVAGTANGTGTAGVILLNSSTALAAGKVLQLANGGNSNLVSIQSGTTSASYTLTLPTALSGNAGDCLVDSTGTGALGFAACGGSPAGSFIQNGTSQQAGANFNIDGSGTIGGILAVGTAADQQITMTAGATHHTIEIGRTDGLTSNPHIDFHSSGGAFDYDARIVASGGTTNGTGILDLRSSQILLSAITRVQPSTDSASAFIVQRGNTDPLFVTDTQNVIVKVIGTDTTYATLQLADAHFKMTQTTAPAIGTPANCGTSPAAAVTAGSTDNAGSFTITTGTGGTSSTCDTTITFRRPFGAAPKSVMVAGKGDVASVTRQPYVVSSTASTVTVGFAVSAGGADSTAYSFSYWVVE